MIGAASVCILIDKKKSRDGISLLVKCPHGLPPRKLVLDLLPRLLFFGLDLLDARCVAAASSGHSVVPLNTAEMVAQADTRDVDLHFTRPGMRV